MKKDLRNKTFGKLLVLDFHSKTRNGHIRYSCECICGNKANVLGTHLIQGNTKSCGCDRPIGKSHPQWSGTGEISGDFWYCHVVRSAMGAKGRKPIELSITKEDAWNIFLKQNRKCALTGLQLKFPTKWKSKDWDASLDRIDSSKGYIEGNVQWVHKDINMMKRIYDQNHFINMCKLVAQKANYNTCEINI